jgi:hypothetical protein
MKEGWIKLVENGGGNRKDSKNWASTSVMGLKKPGIDRYKSQSEWSYVWECKEYFVATFKIKIGFSILKFLIDKLQ